MNQKEKRAFRPQNHLRLFMSVFVTACALSLLFIGVQAVPSSAQDQLFSNPREAPSAAGEMYILREAGLVPEFKQVPLMIEKAPRIAVSEQLAEQPGINVIVNDPTDDTPENTTQSLYCSKFLREVSTYLSPNKQPH